MAEGNQTQNQRKTIGYSIAYASPREFTSIMRPTINKRIAEMKLASLQLISSHQFSEQIMKIHIHIKCKHWI